MPASRQSNLVEPSIAAESQVCNGCSGCGTSRVAGPANETPLTALVDIGCPKHSVVNQITGLCVGGEVGYNVHVWSHSFWGKFLRFPLTGRAVVSKKLPFTGSHARIDIGKLRQRLLHFTGFNLSRRFFGREQPLLRHNVQVSSGQRTVIGKVNVGSLARRSRDKQGISGDQNRPEGHGLVFNIQNVLPRPWGRGSIVLKYLVNEDLKLAPVRNQGILKEVYTPVRERTVSILVGVLYARG